MTTISFNELGLPVEMVKSIASFGYESPSPIQAEAIPYLLDGRDIIGQAQTGTGKTAAFALPLLCNIAPQVRHPQVLVLAPTRELAIQVAESFQKYARSIPDFHVLPIYGGQAYQHQLNPLRRGVHVVVGTPGRVCDHLRRGSLKLDNLQCLVLDEADEMLRMGFIEDVNWVLEQTPEQRQIALFSATMPPEIKKIARKYLHDPAEVKIKVQQTTAETINQRYQIIGGRRKIDALGRILEAEETNAVLIFVRTRNATSVVSEQLEARGFAAASLNGDIPQAQREQIVQRLKDGRLDILVATDVAARGLDVSRISHVINFDAPTDPESYVHRIGRTGRAGSTGEAILFVTPREKRLLTMLGRATRADIQPMKMPSIDEVNEQRIERFKNKIGDVINSDKLEFNTRLIDSFLTDNPEFEANQVAAALAFIAQGEKDFLLKSNETFGQDNFVDSGKRKGDRFDDRRGGRERGGRDNDRGRGRERGGRDNDRGRERGGRERGPKGGKNPTITQSDEKGMERFRVEVGYRDDIKPGALVAAIADTSGLQGKHIGRIEIYENFSTVDLPEGMPKEVFEDLSHTTVRRQPLKITRVEG